MKSNSATFGLVNKFYDNLDDILFDIDFIKKNKTTLYGDVASVFDIEASSFYINDNKAATMYAWVFGINGRCIRGRTWEEFENTIEHLVNVYDLNICKRLVIYVHNLSYEFQWIKKHFQWYKVFCLDSREPIYAITKDGIEFRCSYLLSGYSLATLGKNLLKYKVEKMVGDLDYDLLRHSKTPLTDKEWKYILNDGLVVMAYIQEERERLGNIISIPLTKTGYVRNLCIEKCLKGDERFDYNKTIKTLIINVDDYNQLKRTFAGGFTHANHNYVGKINKEVSSFDFTSSYPAVMLSEKFPMSRPRKVKIQSKEDFVNKLNKYCCMFDCNFYNIRSIFDYEHYISKARCTVCEDFIIDNGRIVQAQKIQLSLTEQDFIIIAKTYDWDYIEVGNFKIFEKRYLPKSLLLTILQLYSDKTTLKGIKDKETEYMVSKGMLNSCYGMCVTDPCRDDINYDNEKGWFINDKDIEGLINMYNFSPRRFLYYPWGIWITAYARKNLFSGILEFKEDYIYSDTDSLKVFNKDKHQKYINDYNTNIQNKIKECLKYSDIDYKLAIPKTKEGIEKPLGVWDYEGTYKYFKTLGAKRYMFIEDNELNITISGVNKNTGKDYLFYKYKTINNILKNFEEGLVFPARYIKDGIEYKGSGKLCHTYLDAYMCCELTDYLGNKAICCEYSSVHLEPVEYNLSLDAEFKRYLLKGVGK